MQFGEKLVLLREKHNMSQEELAEKLDVTRQTISNWENGKVAVDANKAVEICRLFDVDMNYLFLDADKSVESVDNNSNASNKPNSKHKFLIVCCVVVLLAVVATFIFASICLAQSDNTVSSTITLSTQAGLIILIVTCILSIVLVVTVLLTILFKRK